MSLAPPAPVFDPGTVWLVGAGPGDPGLLTYHAGAALAQADTIIADDLVDPRILDLVPATAELILAGKRAGRPSVRQVDITDTLITLAQAGRRVVRLKGGDPFVFGRGSEEMAGLQAAGIQFRVIPGVSSGLAALAMHGIPATSRATNHAIILATGHAAPGEAEADWMALARSEAPIILYMAVTRLREITEALMAGGRAANTPALAVCAATTQDETVTLASLAQLPSLAEQGVIRSPAIIAIGVLAGPFLPTGGVRPG